VLRDPQGQSVDSFRVSVITRLQYLVLKNRSDKKVKDIKFSTKNVLFIFVLQATGIEESNIEIEPVYISTYIEMLLEAES